MNEASPLHHYRLARVYSPAWWRFWWWLVPRHRHAIAMAHKLIEGGFWPKGGGLNTNRYVIEVRGRKYRILSRDERLRASPTDHDRLMGNES